MESCPYRRGPALTRAGEAGLEFSISNFGCVWDFGFRI